MPQLTYIHIQAEEQRAMHTAVKESMILAAVAAGGGDEPAVREEIEAADHLARHGKPVTTRLKEWAFSGLTPPEKEQPVVDDGSKRGGVLGSITGLWR